MPSHDNVIEGSSSQRTRVVFGVTDHTPNDGQYSLASLTSTSTHKNRDTRRDQISGGN